MIFDDLTLSSQMSYNQRKNHTVGFVELANGRESLFADPALTFMIKGINNHWKQSLVFYFFKGGVYSSHLKSLIIQVAKKSFSIGLNVIFIFHFILLCYCHSLRPICSKL